MIDSVGGGVGSLQGNLILPLDRWCGDGWWVVGSGDDVGGGTRDNQILGEYRFIFNAIRCERR